MIEQLWKRLHEQDAKTKESQLASAKQETQTDLHLIPLAELPARLQTNFETGLEEAAVRRRQAADGLNCLEPPPTVPRWVKFAAHIFEGFSALLWVGAALCIFAYALDPAEEDNLYLGVLLVVVVLCSGVFSYLQEAKSEAIMDCFKRMVPQQATVIRCGGRRQAVDSEQLVVGDLVEVKAGDRVPADVRLIAASGVKVDNSSLTGESEPQMRSVGGAGGHEKNASVFIESPHMLFFSTCLVEGWARAVVVATGDRTVMGKIAHLTATLEHGDTPLAREIAHFVHVLTVVSVSLATVFLLLAIAVGTPLIVSVVFFISIIVASVPEGLLATVTVCLTLTAKRMAHKNCLVKNLQAVETLGSTSTICSDKTGTLTQNRMTVSHLWINGGLTLLDAADIEYGHLVLPSDMTSFSATSTTPTLISSSIGNSSSSEGSSEDGTVLMSGGPPGAFEAASLICCLCSRAEFKADQAHLPISNRVTVGDASESAILKFMEAMLDGERCRGGVQAVRRRHPMVAEVPFNSATKVHLTVHRVISSGSTEGDQQPKDHHFLLCLKGAPERILDRCSTVLTDEGGGGGGGSPGPGPLPVQDPAFQTAFQEAYQHLGGLGERVLGLAQLELPADRFPPDYQFAVEPAPNFPTSGLQFVGLISMVDPPRPGVEGAVEKCRSAGIKVVMVTGDHPLTARAIARSVNIIHEGSRICSLADVREEEKETSEGELNRSTTESTEESDGKQPQQQQPQQQQALPPPPAQRQSKAIVVTGAEIAELSEAALDRVIATFDEIVFARTSPQQKLKIVEGFQRRGEVVAVTGDGVNDSPALKRADIGVAMGITGSDVSKQAADMILLDDNFASIVVGVEEGRLIFDNLKKSIAYTLTSNIPEMVPFLLYILLGLPLGLGTVTILCIDIGTDIFPAISLAYEPAESDIMCRRPRTSAERLVSHRMIQVTYFYVGIISTAAGFLAYFVIMAEHGFFLVGLTTVRARGWERPGEEAVVDWYGQEWHYAARRRLEATCQTAFFVAIVVTQWFDLLICRTRRNSLLQQGMTNDVLSFALIFETGLTIFLVYCPGMVPLLKLYPLKWVWWIFGLPFGLLLLLLDEWRRWAIRHHPGGFIERETYY